MWGGYRNLLIVSLFGRFGLLCSGLSMILCINSETAVAEANNPACPATPPSALQLSSSVYPTRGDECPGGILVGAICCGGYFFSGG